MGNYSKHQDEIFIGEIYDARHDAVLDRMPLKTGQGKLTPGQVVKANDDGTVQAYTSSDTPYGIALENADSTSGQDTHVSVLVHGTVKKCKVKVGAAEAAAADILKLRTAGIYVLN